jgi:heme O synthase-like polyprenyltransferase
MNTHIGAISGSLPPVLGYLAAGGSLTISISGLSMSIINPVPAGLFLYMMGW